MENKINSRREFLKILGGTLAVIVISKVTEILPKKEVVDFLNTKNSSSYGHSSYGGFKK